MADSLYGLSERALVLCEERANLLSSNIVNSATPHYKARDIDFHKLLQDASNQADALGVSDPKHIKTNGTDGSLPVLYRVPMQSNLDGNTVDEDIERKNFIQNALNYQVNLTFVKNKTDQIMKAIKGE
ncbi:flagellar basal body rod protein FlgB [Aquicella lusitana]|uniref:Flagellar basal body rod protein FlgB n=1 Tax=Aquicella lusitana TaxID=254246 RepID=A0A370G825_9COXI|nr:flagellar basal body rod protein FlgB [Aquicella lusitana]RDI39955.1 flagellar basal-body rod protein FlgB [Aquicella lusitana]VVC74558.1 Flagellar basal body rod protein FlgB [Aquicella lusitana]